MLRRTAGVFALGLVAILAVVPFSPAKPPDLPENLIITVHPIQVLQLDQNLVFFETPLKCESPCTPKESCHVDFSSAPTVLQNLEKLLEAHKLLEKAKSLANEGDLRKSKKCLVKVKTMCPGVFDERCEEIATLIAAQLDLTWTVEVPRTGGEEASEEETPILPGCCFHMMTQTGPCWMSQMLSAAGHYCPIAKAHYVAIQSGKEVMCDGLLKAAHLALDAGRCTKAAELVRQAHALCPDRVESDPLAYKLHMQTPVRGGEESAEPKELPIHPRQHRGVKILNKVLDTDPEAVEALDKLLIEPEAKCCPFDCDACKVAKTMLYHVFFPSEPTDCKDCLVVGLSCGGSPMIRVKVTVGDVVWRAQIGQNFPIVTRKAK